MTERRSCAWHRGGQRRRVSATTIKGPSTQAIGLTMGHDGRGPKSVRFDCRSCHAEARRHRSESTADWEGQARGAACEQTEVGCPSIELVDS